jgi:two-component system, OmpR family, copper resistance phosphate regulon response regulator CusR
MRVLVVEDDRALGNFVKKGLESEYHTVELASDGQEALDWLESTEFDLLVLDLNLPKVDGMTVLSKMGPKNSEMAILILSARSRVEDRVQCLDMGADDYLVKPFSLAELSARVRALGRRGKTVASSALRVADLELDRIERRVTRGGECIELTAKEFNLLEYLLQKAGKRVTRTMIMEKVWGVAFDTSTNVVDVYINYLRKKVDDGRSPRLIHTIRGVGYELSVTGEEL